jgi:hypothetical protein
MSGSTRRDEATTGLFRTRTPPMWLIVLLADYPGAIAVHDQPQPEPPNRIDGLGVPVGQAT